MASSIISFNKNHDQLKIPPSVHSSASSIVPAVHWLGLILCSSLQERIHAKKHTLVSLMGPIRKPLSVPWSLYFCFILVVFFWAKCGGGSPPSLSRPIIAVIRSTLTEYGWSSHKHHRWKHNRSCCMYVLTCGLWPKCGMNSMFINPAWPTPSSHCIGPSTWALVESVC